MAHSDAVEWHSQIATRFDARYQHSRSFRERLQVWADVIAAHQAPGAAALDAGCGSGVLTALAAAHFKSVTAFDGSAAMIALAQRRQSEMAELANTRFLELRLENLGALADQRFGFIMSSSVLEYVEDFWGTLAALRGLLAAGGTLVFSVPNMSSLYRQAERQVFRATGRPRYLEFVKSQPSADELAKGLPGLGLTVEKRVYFGPAPGLSMPARAIGRPDLADVLVAYVTRAVR